MKTWGSASTLGLILHAAMPLFQPERTRDAQKPAKYGGYDRGVGKALRSTKQVLLVVAKRYWLPKNHGFQLPLHCFCSCKSVGEPSGVRKRPLFRGFPSRTRQASDKSPW